jgi:hypothetical protein
MDLRLQWYVVLSNHDYFALWLRRHSIAMRDSFGRDMNLAPPTWSSPVPPVSSACMPVCACWREVIVDGHILYQPQKLLLDGWHYLSVGCLALSGVVELAP